MLAEAWKKCPAHKLEARRACFLDCTHHKHCSSHVVGHSPEIVERTAGLQKDEKVAVAAV